MRSRAGTFVGRVLAIAVALVAIAGTAVVARAASPLEPWSGDNPFRCRLQQAGLNETGPHPERDPYCVEFDKRHQNVTELGIVDFLLKEPGRTAAAAPKCFYFQSDHWRGSIVQDDATTKTYEFDGHYFFDKARSEGGVRIRNFNVNGRSADPRNFPGFPHEYRPFFGKGGGSVLIHGGAVGDPTCQQRAQSEPKKIYRHPRG